MVRSRDGSLLQICWIMKKSGIFSRNHKSRHFSHALPGLRMASVTALPEASQRGLTLRGLKKLEALVKQLADDGQFVDRDSGAAKNYTAVTTGDVVYQWIKLKEATGSARLADCPTHVDPLDLTQPTYFVSHGAWRPSAPARPLPRMLFLLQL